MQSLLQCWIARFDPIGQTRRVHRYSVQRALVRQYVVISSFSLTGYSKPSNHRMERATAASLDAGQRIDSIRMSSVDGSATRGARERSWFLTLQDACPNVW